MYVLQHTAVTYSSFVQIRIQKNYFEKACLEISKNINFQEGAHTQSVELKIHSGVFKALAKCFTYKMRTTIL